jgi:hypothetical protein
MTNLRPAVRVRSQRYWYWTFEALVAGCQKAIYRIGYGNFFLAPIFQVADYGLVADSSLLVLHQDARCAPHLCHQGLRGWCERLIAARNE